MKKLGTLFWIVVFAATTFAPLLRPDTASAQDRREQAEDRRERRDDNNERRERVDDRRERVDNRNERRERVDDRQERVDNRNERRDDRWEDTWRERHQRFERWEDWREVRGAIAGARIMLGMIFATLPNDHTVVVIDGKTYYVHEHVFFTEVVRTGIHSYEVVRAPIGATVTVLPAGHKIVEINGVRYHIYDDVYYRPRGNGYVIVVKP